MAAETALVVMNARGSSFIPLKLALTPPHASERDGTDISQPNCRPPTATRSTAGAAQSKPLPQVLHGPSSSISQSVGKPLSVARTPQATQSSSKRPSSATSGFHDEWQQLVKERAHLSALVATSPQGSTQAERDAWRSTQTRNEAAAQASEASGDHVLASAYLAAAEAAAATRRAAAEAAGLSSWYERLVNVHPSVKNAVDHALVQAANEADATRATAAAPPAARVSNGAFAGPGRDFSHADAIGYRMVSSPLDQWRAMSRDMRRDMSSPLDQWRAMRGALEFAAAGARYEPRGAWSWPGNQTRRSQLVACQLQAHEPGKPVRMFTAIPQQRRKLGEHAIGERHGEHHVERHGERHGERELRAESVMRDRTAGTSNWYEQCIAPTLNEALETVRVAASPFLVTASPTGTGAKKPLATRESTVLALSKQAVDQRAENDIRGLGVHVALPIEPAARPSHADRLEDAIAARRSEAAERLTDAMKAAAARRREVARERAPRNSAAAAGAQFKDLAAAEKAAAEKVAAEKAAAEKAAAEKAATDEAAAENARAAARRCREREIALELKQQLELQRREREKRTAEEARLEVIQRRDAEHKQAAQHRQAAQQAALERQQIEAQRVAVSAARAELTAGCPTRLVQRATELGVDIAMVALELDVEKELDAVLSKGRELCTALREALVTALTKVEAKFDATESCVASWSLAARFVACHRRQELWRRALQLPPPPVLVLFHGTRCSNTEAIVAEGFRLPDGAAVKFSTNLASRHGTGSIFASLNFARALLHADGPRATFLLLALPGDDGPIDHAKATFVFSEEAALLPCYLPQGTEHARELARLAREVARAELYGSGAADM